MWKTNGNSICLLYFEGRFESRFSQQRNKIRLGNNHFLIVPIQSVSEMDVTKVQYCNLLTAKLFNCNFQSLEVVSR